MKCIERVVEATRIGRYESIVKANHHEWVLIEEKWVDGSLPSKAAWRRRYYCKFCLGIKEV